MTADGLLVLDKPTGLTSRDAVNRAQRWFPRRTRLGHTGTLDPLATGVLVLCVGSATRLTEYVQAMRKTYRTTVRLGARSDTDDADGVITPVAGASIPERSVIEDFLRGFIGEIEQVPPAYSAAKVNGRRAHALARSGQEVDLAARRVRIDAIDVLRFEAPLLELEVRCGKGTYVRSLARDLGERLGCGGFVEVLRRTRVGPFRAEDGLSLDADPARARASLLPPRLAVADLPLIELSPFHRDRFQQGQAVSFQCCRLLEQVARGEKECAVADPDGTLLGIGQLEWEEERVRPVKVLVTGG